MVILRDQAEEFPPCQQPYSCQRRSPKVRYAGPKSRTEVGGRNVIKENREYQVKKDDRNIQESMRENEKQADDPVGSEVDPKASEMGRAIGGGSKGSERYGGSGNKP